MTDEQIIRFVEHAMYSAKGEDGFKEIYWEHFKNILDLINRQKAEIDRLQEEVRIANIAGVTAEQQALKECREKHKIAQGIKTARSDAVNKFVEKLKAKALVVHKTRSGKLTYEIDDDEIDSLVEGQVGE